MQLLLLLQLLLSAVPLLSKLVVLLVTVRQSLGSKHVKNWVSPDSKYKENDVESLV